MKNSHAIPLAIALGGVVVAGAMYFTTHQPSTSLSSGNPALVRPIDSNDHIFGNPSAPVKIVEYADFDCIYCSGFNATLHQIIADMGTGGQIAWVYRQFPLIELHPNALKHAEATECAALAGGNDAFWQFADTLFAHQPVDPSQYGTFAKSLNIPSDAFASCYANASTTVAARIMTDRQNAFAIGARGTPYALIVVTGKVPIVIGSAYPYDAVKQLIETAFKGAQ